MNVQQLEQLFKTYFDEIVACRRTGCYWALVHLLVVLPDVCAALQAPDGEATGKSYRDWCRENLGQSPLSPEDRYFMRCSILHQGRAVAPKGTYKTFSFTDPRHTGGRNVHGMVDPSEPTNITIDVDRMADEMIAGAKKWFADLQKATKAKESQYVQTYSRMLVAEKPKNVANPPGTMLTFNVTSST